MKLKPLPPPKPPTLQYTMQTGYTGWSWILVLATGPGYWSWLLVLATGLCYMYPLAASWLRVLVTGCKLLVCELLVYSHTPAGAADCYQYHLAADIVSVCTLLGKRESTNDRIRLRRR